MPIDPNEAPEGYVAVARTSCDGCAFHKGSSWGRGNHCPSGRRSSCAGGERRDGESVIFIKQNPKPKPNPTVKLPQRYSATVPEGSEIPVIYPVRNGGLMRYTDVIAALKAARIAWEEGK